MTDRRRIAERILPLIDLTNLDDNCSVHDVAILCSRADGEFGRTAAVCVWPRFVDACVSTLRGTGIKVATVVNFPSGDDAIEVVISETRGALESGADEIDLVLPYRAFKAGEKLAATSMLQRVREAVRPPAQLKVILETGELLDEELIRQAAQLAVTSGADFIKTSTGKTKVSATIEAASIMLNVIREHRNQSGRMIGFKPSGGIRSVDDARPYLELVDSILGPDWASPSTFRFGASALLDAVEAELRQ